jgi:hypothetical protein
MHTNDQSTNYIVHTKFPKIKTPLNDYHDLLSFNVIITT